MTQLKDIVQFLDQTLDSTGFDDGSLNGLQVESGQNEISRVGYAVDAAQSVFDEAIAKGCQLLIVHHGLFWGYCERINGILGRKIRTLIEGGCSLYASHLPLDGHPELGNNAQLIKLLGAEKSQEFCHSGRRTIGWLGSYANPIDLNDFETKLQSITEKQRFLGLKFGPANVKNIAVVSGGAAFAIKEAKEKGADTFITGEPKQNVFHEAKELGMNAFFAGHYATETFGVAATARLLQETFGINIEFIDQPTLI